MRQDATSATYEFDNVYLDFNGVVHECIEKWNLGMTEDGLFVIIEMQLELLADLMNPLALLFIGIDGVAPRAKMNQQRSRRFQTARDAELRKNTVEGVCVDGAFDRNAITPGTDFMLRLATRLRAWAESNASKPRWRGIAIVVSGDLTPGEGEHKIMDIIRAHPDRSHCLFSNDADLVFLGLVSEANHVYLFRAKPNVRGSSDVEATADGIAGDIPRAVEQARKDFELVSIRAIRDWLTREFPDYDVRRVGRDFVALCCLAGNDFLPHVGIVDIYDGGIDKLMVAYKSLPAVADGYIVADDGTLILPRWRLLLEQLMEAEAEALLDAAGLGRGPKRPPYQGPAAPTSDDWDGLSVVTKGIPLRARAEDIRNGFSKQKCVVRSVHALRVEPGSRSPPEWLVRFADARSAVMTLVAGRHVWGQRVTAVWANPNLCDLVDRPQEPFQGVEWQAALDAAILETFEFWLSADNLPNDAFLRRHVRARADRFVPIRVLSTFNRMRIWCQDMTRITNVLRTSLKLEVLGEGLDAFVRGLEDYSIAVGEMPEQVARQHQAMVCLTAGDFAGAVRTLKREYYSRHDGPSTMGAPGLEDLEGMEQYRSREFLVGIEWVAKYYLYGCSSWSWFYPAHYAPLCVSLMDHALEALRLPPLGTPFSPELQLLAVLPPHSVELLPMSLQQLLVDPESPIVGFYPQEFVVDIKPGDKEWQGVALLPFVVEAQLRDALVAMSWEIHTCMVCPRAFLSAKPALADTQLATDGLQCCENGSTIAPPNDAHVWDFRHDERLAGIRACRDPPVENIPGAMSFNGQDSRGRGKGGSKGRGKGGGSRVGKASSGQGGKGGRKGGGKRDVRGGSKDAGEREEGINSRCHPQDFEDAGGSEAEVDVEIEAGTDEAAGGDGSINESFPRTGISAEAD